MGDELLLKCETIREMATDLEVKKADKKDSFDPIFSKENSLEKVLNEEGKIIYSNLGTSMLPLIQQKKDVLTFEKKTRRLKKYEIGLYKSLKGHYVLHRVRKVRKDSYDFLGDNNLYQEKKISEDRVIGILIKITREGKEIPLSGNRYERYIKARINSYYFRIFCHLPIILLRKAKNFLRRELKNEQ